MTEQIPVIVCPNPIFVVGSPRSGTTILAWSLAQHSNLWTSEESEILFSLFGDGKFQAAFEKAHSRPKPSWLKVQGIESKTYLRSLGLGLNAVATSCSGGKRWIEQTPQYCFISDLVSEMFPGSLFVHILRDGRHVVHSMVNVLNKYSQDVVAAREKSGHLPPWPKDFRSACIAWRSSAEACLSFQERNPRRCITVINANLLENTFAEFEKIFQFLGESPEDSVVRYFQGNRINSSFPEDESRLPIEAKRPNPWLKWGLRERFIFLDEAGSTMLNLGLATKEELNPFATEEGKGNGGG
jgi:Sulfotransferase family